MTHAYMTGATGAIGMALAGELLKNGIETTVFLRKGSQRSRRIEDCFGEAIAAGLMKVEYVSLEELGGYMCGDACDKAAAKEDSSVFYHLGWSGTFGAERNDAVLQQRNVEYTLNAVRLAKRLGCSHFIGVGSQAEYGRVEGELTPDTKAVPENEYGRAKLAAGVESAALCGKLGLRHSWVRVLSVYGPFDGKNTMIMSVIRRLLLGKRVPLTMGEQVWNYLYSGDAAKALFLLGMSDAGNTKRYNPDGAAVKETSAVYCLSGDSACELREYILKLCQVIGADEGLLGFGDIAYGDRQVMYLTADISRLTEDTGFIPQVSFDDGIKRTIEWVRTFGVTMYEY